MTYLSSKYPNFHNFITFYPFCAGVRDTRFWLAIIMGLSYCVWYLYSILIKFSDDLIIRIHYRFICDFYWKLLGKISNNRVCIYLKIIIPLHWMLIIHFHFITLCKSQNFETKNGILWSRFISDVFNLIQIVLLAGFSFYFWCYDLRAQIK